MKKKKILIIDDEVDLTQMIKLNLEATGKYDVSIENKGSRAIAAIRTFKPDMVFLDIVMPDADGANVIQQINEEEDLKNIPVVFLTALVKKEETREDSIKTISSHTFLAKPVSTRELIDCIEKNT
ncbi:MAG: response regulator [Candidatus Omnitrophica bacterium]|nr:response regulator [Candidatus Omnitrophota bacterium]